MSRTLSSRVSIALVIFLFGCQQPETSNDPRKASALDRILKEKVMRVGYVKFAPCADVNPQTGKLEGIFVDAIQEIATDMKLEVEFKETTLATFAAALEAKEFDFSIGPTFITPSRAAAVRFTDPLLALGNSGLVRTDRVASFGSIEALGTPQLRVSVLQGQAMEQFVRSRFPKANLIVIAGSDLTAPLAAVSAGQADIGLTNSVTVQQYAMSHPDTAPVFTKEDALSRLALAWVTRSEDERLQRFLDSGIDWLVQSGKLEAIQAAYPIRLSRITE